MRVNLLINFFTKAILRCEVYLVPILDANFLALIVPNLSNLQMLRLPIQLVKVLKFLLVGLFMRREEVLYYHSRFWHSRLLLH